MEHEVTDEQLIAQVKAQLRAQLQVLDLLAESVNIKAQIEELRAEEARLQARREALVAEARKEALADLASEKKLHEQLITSQRAQLAAKKAQAEKDLQARIASLDQRESAVAAREQAIEVSEKDALDRFIAAQAQFAKKKARR
jgi:hypothetical protein